MLLVCFTWGQAQAAPQVLTWSYDDSALPVGFKVHYGSTSHGYDHVADVGLQKSWALSDLTPGTTTYLAVTAYDGGGNESAYSEEITYIAPKLDSDGDGLADQDEIYVYHTDPLNADSDGDGIGDGDEQAYWGERWSDDLDGDGLINLLDADSDNDGYQDGSEVRQGYDPGYSASNPGEDLTTTVYEDAEDGAGSRWLVYDGDPATAGITNVSDEDRGGRVIQLTGSGIDHGFALTGKDQAPWHNAWEPVVEWSIKVSGEFTVYVDLETSVGHRYLYYTPSNDQGLGAGEYVHHGLGADTTLGEWFTFVRDLQADLEQAQPGVMILEVNRFLVRGSCRLDDIKLHSARPGPLDSDGDTIADADENGRYGTNPNRKDSDNDGIGDSRELKYWGERWFDDGDGDGLINLLDLDSDNDGIGDGVEIERGSDPGDSASQPGSEATVYEDAEDKSTLRWTVYDNVSGKAKIKNSYDKIASSQVISLQGKALVDGFRLTKAGGLPWHNSTQTMVSWTMQYSGPFTIYLDVETTAGHRYLYYGADNEDRLDEGEYIHHGIGTDAANGQWRMVTRDLSQDLEEAQPGVKILEVNGFMVRGSGKIDNVKLLSDWQ